MKDPLEEGAEEALFNHVEITSTSGSINTHRLCVLTYVAQTLGSEQGDGLGRRDGIIIVAIG